MNRKPRESPIQQRRRQIEKELEKLRLPKSQRRRSDFKTDEAFEKWKDRYERKLYELNEEAVLLENPDEYNEVPLAIAAVELGVTLNEMQQIVSEHLVETSFDAEYAAGDRITRDELARAIDIGPGELLRVANQSVEEIFTEAVKFLKSGNIESAEKAYERIQKFDYGHSFQFWISCSIALHLVKREFDDLKYYFDSLKSYDHIKLVAILDSLREAVSGITPPDHRSAIIREQILAVADGVKETPFDQTYSSYRTSEYFSQMDENQRHAMMFASVVLAAIKKYKFSKWISSHRGYSAPDKEDEVERVIRNAIYTAFEAERTYHDSPTSKLFVDKFVELFPKRWIPAERIELLPKTETTRKTDSVN